MIIQCKKHLTRVLLFFIIFISVTGCVKENIPPLVLPESPIEVALEYHDFTSYADFRETLYSIARITNEDHRKDSINIFWDSLVVNNQVPFAIDDSVALLYKKAGTTMYWAGDFNYWSTTAWQGQQVELSDIMIYEVVLPADACLEYSIIDNGIWLNDPDNEYMQQGSFGPHSELRMPAYKYPIETDKREDVTPGVLSDNIIIQSSNLGYKVQYKVYTPYNYNSESNLPVIYVTDGQEYADDLKGSMVIVLDNLIFDGLIKPVMAVFIDPTNPDDLSENRRDEQYRSNIKFADFVADELVTAIGNQYKSSTSADERAILGASYGGWNSSYFALVRSDKFHLIGIQSPSTSYEIIQGYENSTGLPIKVFMSTGVINDTEVQARAVNAAIESKGYPLMYIEINQGHSWGNWRGQLKNLLEYFFPPGS
jgi:enterochelin esterase-like enzyme